MMLPSFVHFFTFIKPVMTSNSSSISEIWLRRDLEDDLDDDLEDDLDDDLELALEDDLEEEKEMLGDQATGVVRPTESS